MDDGREDHRPWQTFLQWLQWAAKPKVPNAIMNIGVVLLDEF